MIQFDEHIFQMGWFNHQQEIHSSVLSRVTWWNPLCFVDGFFLNVWNSLVSGDVILQTKVALWLMDSKSLKMVQHSRNLKDFMKVYMNYSSTDPTQLRVLGSWWPAMTTVEMFKGYYSQHHQLTSFPGKCAGSQRTFFRQMRLASLSRCLRWAFSNGRVGCLHTSNSTGNRPGDSGRWPAGFQHQDLLFHTNVHDRITINPTPVTRSW